jgi:NitT/TauT family transport system ATP-binding protein
MIALEGVSLRYPHANGNRTPALDNVSLDIGEGEFVCLLGPSGCGKTSLLNLIAGFLTPTTGRILFQGAPVTGPSPERSVVFQDPTLFPWLTVRGNVEFGLRCMKLPKEERQRKIDECIAMVGLSGYEDAYRHELSGGMRQRAALARVLALDPPALLMDEPFSALDANSRERLQDELLRIWIARRRTIAFVTHSVEEAAVLADRVIVIGTHPDSVKQVVSIDLPRPRPRASTVVQETIRGLRAVLDDMPCCLPHNRTRSRT